MAIPIFKTFSTIVSETLTAIGERTSLTNFNVGGTIRTITEVFSEVTGELYAYGSDMLKQGFMATAQGAWLVNKVKEVGVEPKDVITTEGTVMFSRPTARDTNITIPMDSIVATRKDQSGREVPLLHNRRGHLASGMHIRSRAGHCRESRQRLQRRGGIHHRYEDLYQRDLRSHQPAGLDNHRGCG